MNLFTRSLLVTGQLSCFETLLMSFSLSLHSMGQSYIRWSTVWFPPSQGHSEDSVILNRRRYALVLQCTVMIAVKFGVNLIVIFNLSLIIGKDSFIVKAFIVEFHSVCHLAVLWSLTC